ncbi:MAG: efflux RND transporter periplasmic adaptor subunit [Tannerellaceae bacterium]|nr:efflux RND transporter periplasmic adaptor subunit [Tannerellaceae bacterium]
MNKQIIIACLFVLLTSTCKKDNHAAALGGEVWEGDTLVVSPGSAVNSGIRLYKVEQKDFIRQFHTTGVVRAITGHIAGIAPLFNGRLTRSFVTLGQKVEAGDPLFELYSAEFSAVVKDYFQSREDKTVKESNFRRQQDLVHNGAGVVREMEEAGAAYEVALKDYENAIYGLDILNIDHNAVHMGEALTVRSPIGGEVLSTDIVIGQYVSSDAPPLAIVASLDKVWVVAMVKEGYIGSIHRDDSVEVSVDGGGKIAGRITYISELLDEDTRSLQVFITCDNKDRQLKPGMFAAVRFTGAPRSSILIPSTSLLQDGEGAYVFVSVSRDTSGNPGDCPGDCPDGGRYIKRRVITSTAGEGEALVEEGLSAGEVIIAGGGVYLMGD